MSATHVSVDGPGTGPAESPRPRRPRRGRRGRIIAVVVIVLAGAGAAVVVTDPFGGSGKAPSIDSDAPTALAKVTQGTLEARTQENGTLGYAGSYDVINQASGTITKLPSVGKIFRQGRALYWVNGKPVVLLYGAYVPVYRALKEGMKGVDVRQLNAALVDLGYASGTGLSSTSSYFSSSTAYALEQMQDDMGLDETGELPLGQAVFMPAKEIRVLTVTGVRGGPIAPKSTVITASSTDRQVTVSLNASQQTQVKEGDKVTITLPTGRTTNGVVRSVGKVAKKDSSGGSAKITVNIRPTDQKATGRLDQAPVQVAIVTDTAKDVLSVPVNALLALVSGGYAVEVAEANGVRKLVPVETGLFDDSAGRVEVSGNGLAAGQNIVVPAS
ncbi:HlyD family secretion protein [Actinomadura rubteroloni]|uniref:HlyD family secretion protein n=1 Tax=Actinomadura rubteroloni TaxID=1926885 RepID=A0A2P4UIX8_9ACTN|nr:peptidoglycan-binding protein [Actinomadura rubteroloni]POM24981.1 HlyD family secretion protein [Actinomadura rubteroloni]